jgi:hypothetical protein
MLSALNPTLFTEHCNTLSHPTLNFIKMKIDLGVMQDSNSSEDICSVELSLTVS